MSRDPSPPCSGPSEARPPSPCIQVCRIEPTDQVCEGCRRTLDEIARWSRMSEAEREPVWQRLEREGSEPSRENSDESAR